MSLSSMKLYFLRHGQAEAIAPLDEMRALTETGIAETEKMLLWFKQQEPHIQNIFNSSYLRAQQSCQIVLNTLNFEGKAEESSLITPHSDPIDFLKNILRRLTTDTLLVTHQPFMGKLMSYLISGYGGAKFPIETSALAMIEFKDNLVGLGSGQLVWLKNIKDLD